ncbi:MAG: hypothetical protein Q7S82_02700 [bacterium]|nr:hypothetical protein [bacterium]
MQEKIFVISLGGSVAVPEEINTSFLKRFSKIIKEEVKKGRKFFIVIGGGKTSRKYQKALSEISKSSNEEKDWIGIKATELNSLLLKAVFNKMANPVIFDRRFKIKKFGEYPVIIGCGWKPGWSTDFISVQIAADFKVDKIINLGKPAYVYADNVEELHSSSPFVPYSSEAKSEKELRSLPHGTRVFEKNSKAKPLENISWRDYFKLIPRKWRPGLSAPIDPIAARLAKRNKIQAIVAFGEDLENFKKILAGKKFKGTLIS